MKSVVQHETDNLLKAILPILKNDIICKFQHILRVYSNDRFLSDHHSLELLQATPWHVAKSVMHSVYSIIIVRDLKNWMNRTEIIIKDLPHAVF